MSKVDEIKKQHEVGYPKLVKLFCMSDKDLKEYLGNLLPDLKSNKKGIFEDSSAVKRSIVDGVINELSISFYDTLEVCWMGIYFKPEHGSSQKLLSFSNELIDINIPDVEYYCPICATWTVCNEN